MALCALFLLITLEARLLRVAAVAGLLRSERESQVDRPDNLVLEGNLLMPMDEYTSTYEHVWGSHDHCRLRAALDSRGKKDVILAAAGGSATSGAGDAGVNGSWFNVLGERLGPVIVRNGAQGGTDSFWSSMTLDSVHPDADIIFWEYAINDCNGESTGWNTSTPDEMALHLELWLRRAAQLPSRPAIVLVYLYDASSTKNSKFVSSPLAAGNAVLKRFMEAGLDVLVVPVGALMRDMIAKGQPALADEEAKHHPSKAAHVLIADLVERELMKAAAASPQGCSLKRHVLSTAHVAPAPLIRHSPTLTTIASSNLVSLTNYWPRFEDPADDADLVVAVCNQSTSGTCVEDSIRRLGKSDPKRSDRKSGWRLPRCTSEGLDKVSPLPDTVDVQTMLTIALADRGLCEKVKLIALDVRRGEQNSHPWTTELVVDVSGKERQIINRQLAKIPFYVERFDTADGTIADLDQIPSVLRHRFNVFLDLEASTKEMAETVFQKQVLLSLPGDAIKLPENRCKQVSICAVRAFDDTSPQGVIQAISLFY